MPTTSTTKRIAANKAGGGNQAAPAPSGTSNTIKRGSATPRAAGARAAKVADNKQRVANINAAREAADAKAAEKLAALSDDDKATANRHAHMSTAERAAVTEGAKQEAANIAEAKKAGQPTDSIETPNLAILDAVSRAKAAGFKTARQGSGTPRARREKAEPNPQTVTYTVDGKPVAPTQNRLSSISRVTATKDAARWPAPELRQWLVAQGISDPEHTEWTATLPNGRVLGAVLTAKLSKAS